MQSRQSMMCRRRSAELDNSGRDRARRRCCHCHLQSGTEATPPDCSPRSRFPRRQSLHCGGDGFLELPQRRQKGVQGQGILEIKGRRDVPGGCQGDASHAGDRALDVVQGQLHAAPPHSRADGAARGRGKRSDAKRMKRTAPGGGVGRVAHAPSMLRSARGTIHVWNLTRHYMKANRTRCINK